MKLKVGDQAPSFAVPDQDGTVITLSSLKGKRVVLYFYPHDMTPGCTTEACNLRDNYRVLVKEGFVVLGISTDDENTHRKFIKKERLPFSLLADTDRKMHDAYGTWVEKSMYGRKYMGTARVTFVLDEKGKIVEIIDKVDTGNHAAQILQQEATAAPKRKVSSKVKSSSSKLDSGKAPAGRKPKKSSARRKS